MTKAKQRYVGRLAYNGSAYVGFQRQAELPTVQGALEAALARLAGEPTPIIGAGRTDAGVHARGQVIAFDLDWRHPTARLLPAINANMPRDIVLQSLDLAPPQFHPRYDALSRRYAYQFYSAALPDPLRDVQMWYVGARFDFEAVHACLKQIIGLHDFASFGWPTQGDVTLRHMIAAECYAGADGQHVFEFEANAFLKRMVRKLVWALVRVGQGLWTETAFGACLAAAQISQGLGSAPPQGLILTAVTYPEDVLKVELVDDESKDMDPQS